MVKDEPSAVQRKRGTEKKAARTTKEGIEGCDITFNNARHHDDGEGGSKGKGRRTLHGLNAISQRPIVLLVAVAMVVLVLRLTYSSAPVMYRRDLLRQRAGMGTIIYGTAWKGPDTSRLVAEAIRAGFRHVATAARHGNYNESGVGDGWTTAVADMGLAREDIFIQTMFVPFGSADLASGNHKAANIEEEVRSSVHTSLANLRTSYLDIVLYHNVKNKLEPIENMMAGWRVLESFVDDGTIRYLGITNCHDLNYLQSVYNQSRVKPVIVQNRFHKNRQFGVPLYPFLQEKNITWQMFWVLTGNGGVLNKDVTKQLSEARNLTPHTFMYAFVLSLGGSPMIGTKSRQHMDEDLKVAKQFDDKGTQAFFEDDKDRQKFAAALGKPDLI